MFKLRLAILGAAAALALGSAGVLAMTETGSTDSDSHGDAVASAARSCPHHASADRDSHGDCVSAIASTNGNDTDNESGTHGKSTAPGQVCKAADASEAAEPKDKAADRTEDRAEQQAFVACVTSHAQAKPGS